MTEQERRKAFQRLKSLTNEQFWEQMNILHSAAYFLGQKHLKEAMSCHPRISARMIEEVEQKAEEIREQWDQMPSIDIDATQRQVFQTIIGGGQ